MIDGCNFDCVGDASISGHYLTRHLSTIETISARNSVEMDVPPPLSGHHNHTRDNAATTISTRGNYHKPRGASMIFRTQPVNVTCVHCNQTNMTDVIKVKGCLWTAYYVHKCPNCFILLGEYTGC